jgi:hypothetical protein
VVLITKKTIEELVKETARSGHLQIIYMHEYIKHSHDASANSCIDRGAAAAYQAV